MSTITSLFAVNTLTTNPQWFVHKTKWDRPYICITIFICLYIRNNLVLSGESFKTLCCCYFKHSIKKSPYPLQIQQPVYLFKWLSRKTGHSPHDRCNQWSWLDFLGSSINDPSKTLLLTMKCQYLLYPLNHGIQGLFSSPQPFFQLLYCNKIDKS